MSGSFSRCVTTLISLATINVVIVEVMLVMFSNVFNLLGDLS